MHKLRIYLTEADIFNAERFKISNLILYALQNATGTLWRLNESGLALETMFPFRVILLPNHIVHNWSRETVNTGALPYEYDLEPFRLPVENNGLLRHFHELNEKQRANRPEDIGRPYKTSADPALLALLAALQRDGWNELRAVCSQIIIETIPPHRTFVLKKETLRVVNEWLEPTVFQGNPEPVVSVQPQMHILLELHSPLDSGAVQNIMIKLDHVH